MNKLPSTIARANLKNLISLSDFKSMRQTDSSVLTVEISKEPSTLLANSLWIGYRNGGMASWLSTLLPHLPHRRFCLYMDEDAYQGSEYMYGYYSDYFSKLFHKEYIGTCIHPRKLVPSRQMASLTEIKPHEISHHLSSQTHFDSPVAFLDFRNSDAAKADCLTKESQKFKNAQYINLPLNDDDLPELLHSKTSHLPADTKFVTLCAKGYRSLIGYSFLRLIKGDQWDVQLCRSPFSEVKKQLNKPVKKQVQAPTRALNFESLAMA